MPFKINLVTCMVKLFLIAKYRILTETAEGNKSSDHKRGVQVELLFGLIVSPAIAFSVVEDPEDSQSRDADQQDGGEGDDESIFAPLAGASLMVVRLIGATALAGKITKIIKHLKFDYLFTYLRINKTRLSEIISSRSLCVPH